ncbi:MAG: hypothetical protein J6B85_05995 [Lachnospiraceae bacterium]|nr:hypothetical protein [Lachnospiraceae bacterium]
MFDAEENIPSPDELIRRCGLQRYGPVQTAVDSECIRMMEPYTPMRNGELIASVTRETVIGSGIIRQNVPYAHYQYEGIIYVDPKTGAAGFLDKNGMWKSRKNVTKIPTDRPLTYYGGGKRGKKWFDRMKADHMDDIKQVALAEIEKAKAGNS